MTVSPSLDTADVINAGIGQLTRAFMDMGADQERAFDVAYTATITMLAKERPDVLNKYLATMIAKNPELDHYVTDPEVMDAISEFRAERGL